MSLTNPPTSTTPTTLIGQMEAQQALLGLSDQELCAALGFERGIALALIKQGAMKLPLNKIPALAGALQLDAAELFTLALRESDPVLSQIVEDLFRPLHMSATEVNLIKHLRELSGGRQGAPIVLDGRSVIAVVAA